MMRECPYPGLRPFERGESHLFFGRDEQIEQLLDKLAETRFIAVTGLSGCGKSSLVRAGLLANLEYGYLTEAGADWSVLAMRPGLHPLRHLAESLLEIGVTHEDAQSVTRSERVARIAQQLASGGHLELARMLQPLTSAERPRNVLLLVDQFEELFRYESQGSLEERRFFVEMLLTSAAQQDVPIYIVITIRSDWLGQCAQFRGLPEVINAGQYLVPRLTPEQLRLAIVAPAHVAEGAIEDRLVLRLLKEIENNQDQLPVLQHCLMRMWTRQSPVTLNAREVAETSQVCLTEADYDAVGGLLNALSNHADDAYNQLADRQKQIAEILFRRLSERGANQLDMRRPTPLGEVAAVAGVSPDEVKEVVEAFRHPDCCFLTPAPPVPLESETVLDISHESLIRLWERLKEWSIEEAESAEIYKHLEKTAIFWKQGKAALWSEPDLGVALKWQEQEKPTSEWAKRYGNHFGIATKFLYVSINRKHRKKIFRLSIFSIILIAVLSIIGSVTVTKWLEYKELIRQRSQMDKINIISDNELNASLSRLFESDNSFNLLVNNKIDIVPVQSKNSILPFFSGIVENLEFTAIKSIELHKQDERFYLDVTVVVKNPSEKELRIVDVNFFFYFEIQDAKRRTFIGRANDNDEEKNSLKPGEANEIVFHIDMGNAVSDVHRLIVDIINSFKNSFSNQITYYCEGGFSIGIKSARGWTYGEGGELLWKFRIDDSSFKTEQFDVIDIEKVDEFFEQADSEKEDEKIILLTNKNTDFGIIKTPKKLKFGFMSFLDQLDSRFELAGIKNIKIVHEGTYTFLEVVLVVRNYNDKVFLLANRKTAFYFSKSADDMKFIGEDSNPQERVLDAGTSNLITYYINMGTDQRRIVQIIFEIMHLLKDPSYEFPLFIDSSFDIGVGSQRGWTFDRGLRAEWVFHSRFQEGDLLLKPMFE